MLYDSYFIDFRATKSRINITTDSSTEVSNSFYPYSKLFKKVTSVFISKFYHDENVLKLQQIIDASICVESLFIEGQKLLEIWETNQSLIENLKIKYLYIKYQNNSEINNKTFEIINKIKPYSTEFEYSPSFFTVRRNQLENFNFLLALTSIDCFNLSVNYKLNYFAVDFELTFINVPIKIFQSESKACIYVKWKLASLSLIISKINEEFWIKKVKHLDSELFYLHLKSTLLTKFWHYSVITDKSEINNLNNSFPELNEETKVSEVIIPINNLIDFSINKRIFMFLEPFENNKFCFEDIIKNKFTRIEIGSIDNLIYIKELFPNLYLNFHYSLIWNEDDNILDKYTINDNANEINWSDVIILSISIMPILSEKEYELITKLL